MHNIALDQAKITNLKTAVEKKIVVWNKILKI